MNEPTRITIPLSPEEVDALRRNAKRECRHPRDQARYLLRTALGLATGPAPSDGKQKTESGGLVSTPAAAL